MPRTATRGAGIASCVLALATLAVGGVGCNAYRAYVPKRDHDAQPPELPASIEAPAVLVFSKTNGYRHGDAIAAGGSRLSAIAERRGWSLFHTENGAVFNAEDLSRFGATVWLNTSGDVLDAAQKEAFRAWLESGAGFVGIHGTGGDRSYAWAWHPEELVRARFIGHTMGPQLQRARVVVERSDHPATRHLGGEFEHVEEWYSFAASPRDRVTVLASVDERSYSPRIDFLLVDRDIAMGDHPVVWHHCIGRGRALYSALGHEAAAYDTPAVAGLIEGAVAWALGLEGAGCE